MLRFALIVSATLLSACAWPGEAKAVPRVPERVQAVMNQLPEPARPVQMNAAGNGAIYALLPNGSEIIVKEKHNAPVVAVQAWVRTGAIHEGRWLGSGLSHFCEHMLFKGTTKRPTGVLDQEIRGAGGDDNAYTTSERTVYHITTAQEGFSTSFAALADMLMDSTFPPEETTREQAVVMKELERGLDNPDTRLWEAYNRSVYQVHPYRIPVIGYPALVSAVKREDVFAYYQQRYTPALTTFIAVGDFDAAVVLPQMARELAAWKSRAVEPVSIPEEPPQVAARSVTVTHPLAEVPKLIVGFPGVSMRHPDLYALDVLASILGDGRASRLYDTVKEREQAVSEISAYNETPAYAGTFMIIATLENGRSAAARAAILQVLRQAHDQKPSADELARARRKVYRQHLFGQMSAEGQAGDLGSSWFVAGDLDFSDNYLRGIEQVSAEDVLRVARKYLVPERLNEALLLPRRDLENLAQQEQLLAGREVAAVKRSHKEELEALRADPAVAHANLLDEHNLFEFTLKPSGVRVSVRHDDSLPIVSIALSALGGVRWEPAQLPGSANLMAELLDHGTPKRNKLEIAQRIEGLGAKLTTFSDRNAFGLSVNGLNQDTAALLDLAADCLLNANFPEDQLRQVQAEVLQQIAAQEESLFYLGLNALRPLLFAGHPYSRRTLGTPEAVRKATAADLKQLHTAWVQPENLVLSFVGDISALEVLKLVHNRFGALQPGRFAPPPAAAIPPLQKHTAAEVEKEGLTGAIMLLGFQGAGLKEPDRETLDIVSALLSGLGGRLSIALREKQGLAYDLGVYADAQLDGGGVIFYIQSDVKALTPARLGMWKEIERLREERLSAQELRTVKNYVLGNEAIELQDQSELARRLALWQLYGQDAAYLFARRQRLEQVTAQSIQAAAKKYFDPDHYIQTIVKPSAE